MRPYDIDTLPPYEDIMATVPVRRVLTALLRPTQELVRIDRLIALSYGKPREGPDPYPHVVDVGKELWIHNGHHAWLLALLAREKYIDVRVTGCST